MSNVLSTKKNVKNSSSGRWRFRGLGALGCVGSLLTNTEGGRGSLCEPEATHHPPSSVSPWSVGWSPLVPWNRRVCDPSVPSVDLGGTCVQLTEGPLPENTNLNSVLAENSNTRKEKRQKMLCCVNRIASQINAAQDFLKSLADEWKRS